MRTIALLIAALVGAPQLHARLVINELLAANRFESLDDDGDSSDWVEILNTGDTAVDLAGHGLTDDAAVPRKWVLPSHALAPGARLVVRCSGKNRVRARADYVESPDSMLEFTPGLVASDSTWSFLAGSPGAESPPADWSTPEFDDSEWATGAPLFGHGDIDGIASPLPEDGLAAFLRVRFTVEDPSRLPTLVLRAIYDDGFVAYLNGRRVRAVNYASEAEPDFSSRAIQTHRSLDPELFDLTEAIDALQSGENVLGLVPLNWNSQSRTFVIGAELGSVTPMPHTNFRLDVAGGFVGLSDPGGVWIDMVSYGWQAEDRSYGRAPDGSGSFHYMLAPTPGTENDPRVSRTLIPTSVAFSMPSGVYEDGFDVDLSTEMPFEDFVVRYALDGAAPDADSTPATAPIGVSRDVVVRAAGFLDDEMVMRPASRSYFLSGRARSLTLPIMSIAMDPADFQRVHLSTEARGRASELPGFLEILSSDRRSTAALGMGLRLHGGAGRNGGFTIKKAYRAYFRQVYGEKKLRYRAISDTSVSVFDKLVLRSNFNDAFRTGVDRAGYIRDQLIRDLHADMDGVISHGAWYNLFVNGAYRGLYNVVERMDREFFASYFPDEGESWDVIKTREEMLDGDKVEWNRFKRSFNANLSREESFAAAVAALDVESFTRYMILNIWAQNEDWPHNNWYAARPRSDDGKWVFLCWDAEFGIGRVPEGWASDTFTFVFTRGTAPATVVLRGLLSNRGYQRYFLEELDRMLDGPLRAENVLAHIDRLAAIIDADMRAEAALGGSYPAWQRTVDRMREFALRRNPVVRGAIRGSARFNFARIETVTPAVLRPESESMVTLGGHFFTDRTEVVFEATRNGRGASFVSPSVEFVSPRTLRAIVPFELELEGEIDVAVRDPINLGSTLPGGLRISYLRPTVTRIEPSSGSRSGGELVTILGEDFMRDPRVEFAGVPAALTHRVSESLLQVITPRLPGRGTQVVPVQVFNTHPGDLPAPTALEFTLGRSGEFRRGDANGDGSVNVTDAVSILKHLFTAPLDMACLDALDANDSGGVNITDALVLLDFLFRSSNEAPARPYATCGADPTADALECEAGSACF